MQKSRSRGTSIDLQSSPIIELNKEDLSPLSPVQEILTNDASSIKDASKDQQKKRNKTPESKPRHQKLVILTKDGKELQAKIKDPNQVVKQASLRSSIKQFLDLVLDKENSNKVWQENTNHDRSNDASKQRHPLQSSSSSSSTANATTNQTNLIAAKNGNLMNTSNDTLAKSPAASPNTSPHPARLTANKKSKSFFVTPYEMDKIRKEFLMHNNNNQSSYQQPQSAVGAIVPSSSTDSSADLEEGNGSSSYELLLKTKKRSKSEPFLHSWDFSPLPLPHDASSWRRSTSSRSSSTSSDHSTNSSTSNSNNNNGSILPESQSSLSLASDATADVVTILVSSPSMISSPIITMNDNHNINMNNNNHNTIIMNNNSKESPLISSPSSVRLERKFSGSAAALDRPRASSWSALLDQPDPDQVITEMSHEGKKQIVCASVDYLIGSLLSDAFLFDKQFVESVLLAHKIFIDSVQFLEKLFEIYREDDQDKTKLAIRRARVVNTLRKFIELNDIRFEENQVKVLCIFIEQLQATEDPAQLAWAKQLRDILGSLGAKELKTSPKLSAHLPKLARGNSSTSLAVHSSIVPKKIQNMIQPSLSLSFCDVDPVEFARHLTAGDWRMFKKIKINELLQRAWSKADKEAASPNILKLIERFNRTSNWVASEILLTANPKQRITVIERCISLIKCLKDLKNFHGLWTIYSALNKSCIQGLHAEWKGVGRKYIQILQSIDQLMDARSNFKHYRETIRNTDPPFLPFEGIFLTDITFLDENPDFIEGKVNFKKLKILGDILATIKQVQQMDPPPYSESLLLKEYMKRAMVLDDHHLLQVSSQITALQVISKKSHQQRHQTSRVRTFTK